MLWFGDERGYNATLLIMLSMVKRCGLVMKEDITQPSPLLLARLTRCGLVMKEDITQLRTKTYHFNRGCGLVMKEDITQQNRNQCKDECVVVW